MLWILLCQSAMTAMQLQATVNCQVMILGTTEKLGTTLARPSVTCRIAYWRTGIDIDASGFFVILMTEQVVLVRHHAEDRQLF